MAKSPSTVVASPKEPTAEEKKLTQLAALQSEYQTLKEKCEAAAKFHTSDFPSLVRKGEVTNEINALKRELGIK